MKRNTFGKIMSILLAVVMLASMLPATLLTASAEDAVVAEPEAFYSFGNAEGHLNSNAAVKGYTDNHTNWRVFGYGSTGEGGDRFGLVTGTALNKVARFRSNVNGKVWVAFEIDPTVDNLTAGTYEFWLNAQEFSGEAGGSSQSGLGDIWVAKYDPEKTTGEEYMTVKNLVASSVALKVSEKQVMGSCVISDPTSKYIVIIQTTKCEAFFRGFGVTRTGDAPDAPTSEDFEFKNSGSGIKYINTYTTVGTDNPNWIFFDRDGAWDDGTIQISSTAYSRQYIGAGSNQFTHFRAKKANESRAYKTWYAFKYEFQYADYLQPGKYDLSVTVKNAYPYDGAGSYNNKYTFYFAPYVEGKEDGSYYMTAANRVWGPSGLTGNKENVLKTGIVIEDPTVPYILVIENDGGDAQITKFTLKRTGDLPKPVSGVSLDQETATLTVGKTTTLTATVEPEDAEVDKTVTWSSSADGIATVDQNGVVTAVAPGEATITAKTVSGGFTDTCVVTVKPIEYGHRFNYGFKLGDIVSIPELDIIPWKDGFEYTYGITTITDYAMTKGMWKTVATDGIRIHGGLHVNYTQITPINKPDSASNNFVAIKLNVPVGGTYDLSLNLHHGSAAKFYLLPGSTPTSDIGATIAGEDNGLILATEAIPDGSTMTYTVEKVELDAGEHIFVMKTGYYGSIRPASLELVTSGAELFKPVYVGTVDNAVVGEKDNTAVANARIYDTWTHEAYTGDVTFAVADAAVASVEGTTITPAAIGKSTITATLPAGALGKIMPANITVANQELVEAFAEKEVTAFTKGTVSVQAYIKGGGDADVIEPTSTASGNKYKLVAPEAEGYEFLYWVKGLESKKRILSFDATYTYAPVGGSNVIIAVYEAVGGEEEEEAKAEFYNPNGQLITTLTANVAVPDYPVVPGQTVTHWQNRYGKKIYAGDDFTLAGDETEIWVAQCEANEVKITVVAENTKEGTQTVDYGELVTLTASDEGTFNWWEKKNAEGKTEIVGIGTTYSFYAWEDCTVEAVYRTTAPVYTGSAMKILIDTFGTDRKSVMAEFIGFDGVTILEKGINLGTDIAMTTGNMQFTVYNNTGNTAKGYAVFEINGKIFRIEDGE